MYIFWVNSFGFFPVFFKKRVDPWSYGKERRFPLAMGRPGLFVAVQPHARSDRNGANELRMFGKWQGIFFVMKGLCEIFIEEFT